MPNKLFIYYDFKRNDAVIGGRKIASRFAKIKSNQYCLFIKVHIDNSWENSIKYKQYVLFNF